MQNMIIPPTSNPPTSNPPVTGYGSPGTAAVHQHPESAFFKPKINTVGERAPLQPTTSHRQNRLGT